MNLFDLPRPFTLTCLFVLGCCFGSFLNVCIHRFPSRHRLWDQLKSLNSHRSGCPRCSAAIRWHDNIPLLGWLLLRGKCRNCRRPISARYPFVEFLTGALFVLMYWSQMPPERFADLKQTALFNAMGPQVVTGHLSSDVWLHIRYALHMVMICGLIVATFIDLDLRIIPDGCTVPVMLVAFLVSPIFGQTYIVPVWFQDMSVANVVRPELPAALQPLMFYWDSTTFAQQHPHWHGLAISLAGFVAGGGIVWVVRLAGFWVLRQEAMGFGDVILMAMVGSVIGWQPVLVVFFVSPFFAVFAAVMAWLTKRDREIPYGPWLSLGTIFVLLAWPVVWPYAKRIFDMGPVLGVIAVFMTSSLVVCLQLLQIMKRLLGIPLHPPDVAPEDIWTSADHLFYYNNERPDEQTGQWSVTQWPGSRSGRGQAGYHNWKSGGWP